jgi:tetratricopeptide (TPR) repeat protein
VGRIKCCPVVGGFCNKPDIDIGVRKDTFFLAEPFRPERKRKRRERAIRNAVKEVLKESYSDACLRVADKEPKEPAVFCDICLLIQSSAYGIVDITGLNPNVLLELGMMFASGKSVFILVNKKDEESLRVKLPSDIVWKRVIPYEEYIDVEEALSEALRSRPIVEPKPSLAEQVTKVVAQIDPAFGKELDGKLQEFRAEQKAELAKIGKLLEETRESLTRSERTEKIPPSMMKRINAMYKRTEPFGRLMGVPKDLKDRDAVSAFLANAYRHEEKKQYHEAVQDYDSALQVQPENYRLLYRKAQLLVKAGKPKDAIDCLKRYLANKKNDVSALQDLAEAFLLDAKSSSALVTARRALRFSKTLEDKAISLYLCIVAECFMKEKEQAENMTRELLDLLKGRDRFKVKTWTFGPLVPQIRGRMERAYAQKCFRVISLLKGRISPKEFRAQFKEKG